MLLVTCLGGPPALAGTDWPQWRGPGRDGIAPATATLPHPLPEALRQVWRIEVGEGHSSPVVADGFVYVHSRIGEDEVAQAFDLAGGTRLWRHAELTPYRRNPAAFRHGKGPRSTPVVAGDLLCTLGITGRLQCLERDSGELRWRHDFSERFGRTWPDFGTATSPLVADGRLVVHVGGIESGSLSAFDLATGKEVWSWSEEGPAYASPVEVTLAGGADQIVTQSREHLISLAADSGELLWKVRFTTPYTQNAVTPVAHGSLLVFSGLDQGLFAMEALPDSRGSWIVRQVWRNDAEPTYLSTPVTRGDLLFGFSDKKKGHLFCVDAVTGETLWTTEGRMGDNAALIVAGDRLLVLTTEAELLIGEATGEGWRLQARYTIADSPTWAHPALLEDRILVKDKTHLTLWAFD